LDKLKHLILLFILVNNQFISAQQNVTIDETIFIHANASTFVSGESLLYKIYCLKSSDKTPSIISKIAYIELVDSDKNSVFKTKVALENSYGQGDYFIPITLKTGNYKLVGYTDWMLNKSSAALFQIDITIINPFKANEKDANNNIISNNSVNTTIIDSQNSLKENSNINNNNNNIKLNLSKRNFANRELVALKIESINPIVKNGSYSLSVRKIDSLPTKNQISSTVFSSSNINNTVQSLNQESNLILPEIRGEIISGKIASINGKDNVKNITVTLSLPGKSFAFKVVKTDSNGKFIFSIDKTNYNTDITVQIIDDNAEHYTISIDEHQKIDYSKLTFNTNSSLSYIMKESLVNRSISNQIENAYYHKKTDSITNAQNYEPFYYPLAKEYILDDYTRFKTLKETITEVTTEIYHKEKDGKIYLHVNDPNVFPQLPEAALVLVDGLHLENQNELMTYNMKGVYKIELIVGRYYVGSKSFNGLINFSTFNKDFKSTQKGKSIINTPILRPQFKKTYHKTDYSNSTKNERIPDFRNQLFWNPEVKLDNENNNTFYTSDVTGTFEISLEGFTDQGIPISLKDTFQVQ
jgi:hypothetical protein